MRYHPATPKAPRPYTLDRVVRMLITLAGTAAAVWLLSYLSSVLLPFLVAWLVAYLLEPFVQYNKKILRVKNRFLPIVVTLFECILIISALAVFLVPSIIDEMHSVAAMVKHYSANGSSIPFIPPSVHQYLRTYIDFDHIARELTSQDLRNVADTIGSFISGGYSLVMSVFNWFVVILYVVFIMLDYEKLIRGFKSLVPPKYRSTTFRVFTDVKDSMNHYFRGQSLIAFIVGILFCIGFAIIDMPMAIVLGLFIGLLNMVPYLQLISLVPVTLLCLVCSAEGKTDFWTMWWAAMAVYCIIQAIQDLYLTPKIMGRAMGLNPAIILLSLSVWGTLLGFIGLIIALPTTTLLLSYYNIYIADREQSDDDEEEQQQQSQEST